MIYSGEFTREISFPIGGIGTGSVGLAGNGRFVDWEIFNRPAKGSIIKNTHIAVKAKTKDRTYIKVLNGDYTKDLTGSIEKGINCGFGHGPSNGTMCGVPHFKECVFNGEFPIATLTFSDDEFPADVVMTAFNPFIPLDADASSIPAAFFNIEFKNKTDEDITFTAVFTLANPFEDTVNLSGDGRLTVTTSIDKNDVRYGDMSVMTDCEDNEVAQYWYRGDWNDNMDLFIKELTTLDHLQNRVYNEKNTFTNTDTGSVAAHKNIAASKSDNIRFVLSWNVPNNYNYWSKTEHGGWKNYYATIFKSSAESGKYCLDNFESLFKRTLTFKNALFESSLDEAVIDAVSSTLSVLKSPTVLRLEDGSFYGWEGVHELIGSCEGTCQHVYNYAYALCFLFPELERSIRNNEFRYCLYDNGGTIFRMSLPLGSEKLAGYRPCVDGHMGTIIKTYREWKLSGDNEWLKEVFPTVKKMLAFAWSKDNPDLWDPNKDGVLEGRQHHTLDMELFGPSSWLQGFYLGALKAAAEMAEFLDESDTAAEYLAVYESGKRFVKNELFNGEYFMQKIDLSDKTYCERFGCENYWYEEKNELKYQIANGCEIDQVLGQWHANICGLGDIFDKEQLKTALKSIYKYNFKSSMRDAFNTWRIYSLNDEGGVIICSFPNGTPSIPIPYNAETMTGFEYALAGLLISEGFEEEGLTIVKAIRDRYDGKKRNPWNEIECGSNYARAMASFALLPIYSGFTFDLPHKTIGFNPIHKDNFSCLFSIGTAWGNLEWKNDQISVIIKEGYLELEQFNVTADIKEVLVDGKKIDFTYNNPSVKLNNRIEKSLVVRI